MAQVNHVFCKVCRTDTTHINGECSPCSTKFNDERIRMWNAQDLDTKLNNIRERLEKLERGPARY